MFDFQQILDKGLGTQARIILLRRRQISWSHLIRKSKHTIFLLPWQNSLADNHRHMSNPHDF